MSPTCFDRLWIIYKEEPNQLIMCKTRIKVKLGQQCMTYLDILISCYLEIHSRNGNVKKTAYEVNLIHVMWSILHENE